MLIDELPVEILSQVLLKVSHKNDLFECMSVCKLWRRKVAPVFFENTVIQQNHEQFLHLARAKIYNNGDKIGDLVKTLTFGKERGASDDPLLLRENFELLISTLPSLQAIRFHRSSVNNTATYIEYLDKIASCTKLQEVSIVGYLSNPEIERISQLYYSINHQLKRQIETLILFGTSIKFHLENDGQQFLDYITGFTNLKHLTIHNTEEHHGRRGSIHVVSVLDTCDDLHSLKIYNPVYSLETVTGNHKYHLNLSSLSLSIPQLFPDHIAYFIEYVPNLKELDLYVERNLLSNIYALLPYDISFKFTRYLKRLQRFDYHACAELTDNRNVFWNTIQKIYNGQVFSNVQIQLYMVDAQHEAIYFDNEAFNVKCQFHISEFKGIADQFHFFNLNSVTVQYGTDPTSDVVDNTSMSDLLDFAVSHQQVQAYITIGEQQLLLYTKPVEYTYTGELTFSQELSPVQHAYLENVHLDNQLLDKIGTFYPTIKVLDLVNCEIQTQDKRTNGCIIDLLQFRSLEVFIFDIGSLLEHINPILFHWTNGTQNNCYVYDQSNSENGLYSTKLTQNIPKNADNIEIFTAGLQRLEIQIRGKDIELIG